MLQMYWNLLGLHLPQQQGRKRRRGGRETVGRKRKKVQFIITVSQKLTPHEDLQPANFRWSVWSDENIKKFTNSSFVSMQPELIQNLYPIFFKLQNE